MLYKKEIIKLLHQIKQQQERRKLSPDLLKIIDTARLGGAENCQIENHGEN